MSSRNKFRSTTSKNPVEKDTTSFVNLFEEEKVVQDMHMIEEKTRGRAGLADEMAKTSKES